MENAPIIPLETTRIPAGALSLEELPETRRQLALAREKLLAVEVQAAMLTLSELFHERPDIGWFRFYKNESEPYGKEREASCRLACDLWNAYEPFFPDSLLYPNPDIAPDEEDEASDEAEAERTIRADHYRALEAWTESLSAEAFARLSSVTFERPAAASGPQLLESFMRLALGEAGFARWESLRLERDTLPQEPLSHASSEGSRSRGL